MSVLLAAAFALGMGGLTAAEPAGEAKDGEKDKVGFHPVDHASFVISAPEATIYVDPVGKPEAWAGFKAADLILITHIHGDHLAPELLAKLRGKDTVVLGPKAVIEELKYGEAMANGESRKVKGVTVEAVPAYNLSKDRLQFHPKGRDNGYVVTVGGKRIYISGDTEDIPEMRALKDIDFAFICMNLPYTMTVEQAASAVLEMKPKVVIPYHYRSREGKTDLERFEQLVANPSKQGLGPGIEVRKLKWYEPPPPKP